MWVAQIIGYDIEAEIEKTLRFSLGRGVAFTDTAYCHGLMTAWKSATQKISFDQGGQVVTSGDAGELAITNLPEDMVSPAEFDALVDGWAWQGREATIWWVPSNSWADRQLMGRGSLEQPTADLAVGPGDEAKIRWPIRDPRSALIAPLQTKKYGGTNVGPDGVDGSANLKGVPHPVLYGTVSNIPGVLVNSEKQIYHLADRQVDIFCVRDGSLPLIPSTQRANTASLEANEPPPGHFDYVKDTAQGGTYARLGAPAQGRLTFDAGEGVNAADRTHGKIWKRLRQQRCATDLDDLESGVADLDAPYVVGWWWSDPINQRDALDELLASFSGYEVQDHNGIWHLAQLRAPIGSPEINLLRLTEESTLTEIDRPIINMQRVRPNYAPNGAPPYSVNVRWGRNYTIMVASDFLGGAYEPERFRLIDKFSREYRVETKTNDEIWNPATGAGLFPNAPELTITTAYQPGDDFITSPHAEGEAQRILDLLSTLHGQYQVEYVFEIGDFILPGATVRATYPSFGLEASPLLLVLQSSLEVAIGGARAKLVIGFQT